MLSLEDFFEKFQLFEYERRLFEIEICNTNIWEFIRIPIFLLLKKKLVSESISSNSSTIKVGIGGLKEYIKCIFSFQKEIKNTDILFFNHPRRRLENDYYSDIYTDTFLPYVSFKYAVLERFYKFNHLKPVQTKNLIYFDKIEFPAIFINYLPFKNIRDKTELSKIEKLENDIRDFWGVEIKQLRKIIEKNVSRYKYVYPRLKKLLSTINPKLFVVVVSYSFYTQIAIIIAKQLNIPTAELQHGVVGKLHYAYNYPKDALVNSFPDYFLSWGKFWVKNTRMPILKDNIIDIGFPYLEKFKLNNVRKIEKSNQIVVLSQMRDDIAKFAFDLATMINTYTIIFKAHPTEYSSVHTNYPYLSELNNIRVIANDNIPLYNLFAECSLVIGVSSTALIEGLAFDCPIMILQVPGWEYYQQLDNIDGVYFIKNSHEAVQIIDSFSSNEITKNLDSRFFFKDNSIQNLNDYFESILN